ncbi:MAG: hypothetical protein AAB508_04215 [Patescibacteria group bacterium]
MMINVSSKDHFTSFLGALESAQIETSGLKGNLQKVPQILSQQILRRYDLVVPEPEALELFGGMEKIIDEYKRLGMADAVTKLEDYFNHGMTGDLREYVSIERKGLLSPPGKFFGPADWQIDSSPSYLEARWNEAISILEIAKKNPKAKELFIQLQTHLKMCVDIAMENLKTIKYLSSEEKQIDQTILEVAKQKLDIISHGAPNI